MTIVKKLKNHGQLFRRFVYARKLTEPPKTPSNRLHQSPYSVSGKAETIRTKIFPHIETEAEQQEYQFIASLFMDESNPPEDLLKQEGYIEKEIIAKTISLQSYTSFILSLNSSQPSSQGDIHRNPFNTGGYRYFTGIKLLEISKDHGTIGISQSVYFFESLLPFNSLFRDLLDIIACKCCRVNRTS